jgi:hypothetical protein
VTVARTAALAALAAVLFASNAARATEGLVASLSVFTAREQMLAEFDRVPVPVLEAAVLHCDRVATRTLLDFEDGVRCAMAFDALLRRAFADDFAAMISWWRAHRDDRTRD